MTDVANRSRVQSGVPTGGEFSTEQRGENADLMVMNGGMALTAEDRTELAALILADDGACSDTADHVELMESAAACGSWVGGYQVENGSNTWEMASFPSREQLSNWLGWDPGEALAYGPSAMGNDDGATVVFAKPTNGAAAPTRDQLAQVESQVFYQGFTEAAPRFAQAAADAWGAPAAVVTTSFGGESETRVLTNLDPGKLSWLQEFESADNLQIFEPVS